MIARIILRRSAAARGCFAVWYNSRECQLGDYMGSHETFCKKTNEEYLRCMIKEEKGYFHWMFLLLTGQAVSESFRDEKDNFVAQEKSPAS